MTERRSFRSPSTLGDEKESASLRPQARESTTDYSYSYGESSGTHLPANDRAIFETGFIEGKRKAFNREARALERVNDPDPTIKAAKKNREGYFASRLEGTKRKHDRHSDQPWNYRQWYSNQSKNLVERAANLTDDENHEISRGRSYGETAKIIEENYDSCADTKEE